MQITEFLKLTEEDPAKDSRLAISILMSGLSVFLIIVNRFFVQYPLCFDKCRTLLRFRSENEMNKKCPLLLK